MVISIQRHTVEEFERVVSLPENTDKLFEFIGGEIAEMVSNNYASEIAALIIYFIKRICGNRAYVDGSQVQMVAILSAKNAIFLMLPIQAMSDNRNRPMMHTTAIRQNWLSRSFRQPTQRNASPSKSPITWPLALPSGLCGQTSRKWRSTLRGNLLSFLGSTISWAVVKSCLDSN